MTDAAVRRGRETFSIARALSVVAEWLNPLGCPGSTRSRVRDRSVFEAARYVLGRDRMGTKMMIVAGLLSLAACKATDAPPAQTRTTGANDGTPAVANSLGANDHAKAADNTKINERDRHDTVTPTDQGNSKSETDITAAIRKGIMADDALSFDAKNAKVVTVGTKVTLRGPVKNDAEKAAIESIAKKTAGVATVESLLEVKK